MQLNTTLACLLTAAMGLLATQPAAAQVSFDVTYQGRLRSFGSPYNGTADFIVMLWSAPAAGTQLGPGCSFNAVAVDDGYFNLICDFGTDAFSTDEDRWMEIQVQAPSGVGGYTTLLPRQKVTPTPFALQSKSLEFPYIDDDDRPAESLIDLHNSATTGATSAITGRVNSPDGAGLLGIAQGATGAGRGVAGRSDTVDGIGVYGESTSTTGNAAGVFGTAFSENGVGVQGYVDNVIGQTAGVYGVSESEAGTGVLGEANSITGNAVGGKFYSDSSIGTGAWGEATSTFGFNVGVRAYTRSERGKGIYARAFHTGGIDTIAGHFENNTQNTGYGVWGEATYNGDVDTVGVYGRTRSRSEFSAGVFGLADSPFGTPTGIYGESLGGIGIWGYHSGAGGAQEYQIGVVGESNGGAGIGVQGLGETGVYGSGSFGVVGRATAVNNFPGTRGGYFSNVGGADQTTALEAYADNDTGLVHAFQSKLHFLNTDQGSTAGRFFGPVVISDDVSGRSTLTVTGPTQLFGDVIVGGFGSPNADMNISGNLIKGSGTFRIDHPLDPENKYLQHSFVESPDMMNIYNGNVMTDDAGYAQVELPEWFEALNRDFRYQLTVIDTTDSADFIMAKVVQEIEGNAFAIRSSAPHARISWLVTGVRHDPYAEANRVEVELDKPEERRGTYLHAEAYREAPGS